MVAVAEGHGLVPLTPPGTVRGAKFTPVVRVVELPVAVVLVFRLGGLVVLVLAVWGFSRLVGAGGIGYVRVHGAVSRRRRRRRIARRELIRHVVVESVHRRLKGAVVVVVIAEGVRLFHIPGFVDVVPFIIDVV